jgi:hypothetical protein
VVTCVLTSSEACTSGNPATSNAVVMTVYPMLPVSITIAPAANPVCANTRVTYMATALNGGNNPRYQWKFNGVNAGTNNPVYKCTPANNDVIICVLSSNEVCTSGNPATSNTVTMTVNPLPVPAITGASAVFSGTTGVVYTTQAGQVNYSWTISPGGSITSGGTANDHTATITWTTAGPQWIGVNFTNAQTGCRGAAATQFSVTVFSTLPVNRTIQNVIVANGQIVCYDALQTITVAGFGTAFLVQSGGSATMIAGQNIIYLDGTKVEPAGYMRGCITITGQYCGTMAPSIPTVVAGETEAPSTLDLAFFKVYPNPTNEKFMVEYIGEDKIGKINVEIYGMKGDKILSKEFSEERRHEFSLVGRSSGIYLVRIVSVEITKTVRILKQ